VKAFIQFTGYISTTFNARSVVAFQFGNGEVAAFSLVALRKKTFRVLAAVFLLELAN
jgi:hypothetical protein